jgi:hypothetical protein
MSTAEEGGRGAEEEAAVLAADEAAALAAIVEAGDPASHLTSLAERRAARGDVALTARALRAGPAAGVATDATWYLPLVQAARAAKDLTALEAALAAARSVDVTADDVDSVFGSAVAAAREELRA